MSEKTTVIKKLKFIRDNSYKLHNISGASLTNLSNNKVVLNFFAERPTIPEWAELDIEIESGLIRNESAKKEDEFLDVERVFLTGVDLDLNTLKALSTLLLTHLNNIENNKSNK